MAILILRDDSRGIASTGRAIGTLRTCPRTLSELALTIMLERLVILQWGMMLCLTSKADTI